jgi:hypothetical protein
MEDSDNRMPGLDTLRDSDLQFGVERPGFVFRDRILERFGKSR